ncbi:LamG-like jellyroll fold domain-containing protein [Pontibacter chitinilyticus]|uniref:LamG-like jellyroll fold domain-containing protein n=1 Tax=Pontibacter chitinilyticus TaxID=2674989 RepID=UPI00321B88FD
MKTSLRITFSLLFFISINTCFAQGPGYALHFDGYEDYVDCTSSNRGITNAVTAEAWVKTGSNKYHWILGKYDRDSERGYHLIIKYGKAAFAGRDGSGVYRNSGYSQEYVNDNNWHHLAGVCNNGTWQIYVDGILQSQDVTGYTSTLLSNTAPFALGKDFVSNNENYSGTEDEVRVWNRALTQEEIRQHMCHKLTSNEQTGLVAYYRFDDATGNIAEDLSPLRINGTFRNMNPATAWTLSGAPVGDKSVYRYPTKWESSLELVTGIANFSLWQAESSIKGFHLYQIAAAPASVNGITNAGQVKEYYGIFKVGSTGSKYKLRLKQYSLSCAPKLFNRQDNADPTWTEVADTTITPVPILLYQTTANYGEYAATSLQEGSIKINGPAVLCTGATATLSIDAAEGQVSWSNGATGNSIEITQGGTYEVVRTSNGCTSKSTLQVQEVAPPQVDLGPDIAVCPGGVVMLTVPKGIPGTKHFLWSTGATTPNIAVTLPGTYRLTVTNDAGCEASDEVTITKIPTPAYVFPEEVNTCYGQEITIGAEVAGATYQWNVGQTTPKIKVSTPGAYEVFYTVSGCTYNFSIAVTADECPEIPNIITPNGDGKNDTFVVNGVEPGTLQLEIFNRWGKSIYKSAHYANDWAAVGVTTGTYYYLFTSSRTGKAYKGWLEVVK